MGSGRKELLAMLLCAATAMAGKKVKQEPELWWRRGRQSPAAHPGAGGDGRRRGTLRGGKLPETEERFCSGRRGIHEGAGERSEIRGTHLRHRRLCAEAEPAGAVDRGRGCRRE